MESRWFIPLCFVFFAAFVAAMWFYVSHVDEPAPAPAVRPGLLAESDRAAASRVQRRPTGESTIDREVSRPRMRAPRIRRSLERRWRAWRQNVARLADLIDARALRLRSNLGREPAWRLVRGWYDLHAGRPAAALRSFDGVLLRRPETAAALAGKAAALGDLNRRRDAAAVYARLIRLDPRNAAVRYNYGVCLTRLGRLGAAAEQFRETVRLDPRHVRAFYNLAGLAQRDGRLAEALAAWRAFTRLQPDVAGGWFNLGIVQMDLGQPIEAARSFSYAVIIHPDDADAYANLGAAYLQAHDPEAALAAMRIANDLAPCDPAIMKTLVEIHRAIAQWHAPDEASHLASAALLEEQLAAIAESREAARELVAGAESDDSP